MFQYFLRLSLLLLVVGSISCSASKKINLNIDPVITFSPRQIDLGVVKKGESSTMIFPFENTGNQSIEIEMATGCQCSEIIAPIGKVFNPGEKGEIKVIFHSDQEKDFGPQKKTVDVLLIQTDPQTGYQIVKQFWYTVNLEPS